MIVPSIDLMNGHAVQLVRGEQLEIDAGDPLPLAERFARVGDVALIDLDAAKGEGDNRETIARLIRDAGPHARFRVGGGIRDERRAIELLDAGASQIIIGTAATPELLEQLPPERVIVALDEKAGEVVDSGWRRGTGRTITDRMAELRGLCGGYLVTFVDVEGTRAGLPLGRIAQLNDAAGGAKITVAGGVKTASEIGEADRLGADTQVGMALYKGDITLADALAACLVTDRPDGLWSTVVADERGGVLGLAYSNAKSLARAIETGRGVYWSRSRGGIWEKGATSGDSQDLLSIRADCDRDAIIFHVRQHGRGFCHLGVQTCFGPDRGLAAIARHVGSRTQSAPAGSYTKRLLDDPAFLRAKLIEEAGELADAAEPGDVAHEAADVLYFAMVAMARGGVDLAEVERVLEARTQKVTRRPGDAKPGALNP